MLHKTQGIVLKFVKYRETSIIVSIFTEQFGLQSYIVNGVRSAASKKNKIALFQPLTCLDMVVYNKESSDIQRISEMKCTHPFNTISVDIAKTSICLFITELLYKTMNNQYDVSALFTFLQKSILLLDHMNKGYDTFHIRFMLKLSNYLGFSIIQDLASEQKNEVTEYQKALLNQMSNSPYDSEINMKRQVRNELLDIVIYYYRLHFETLRELKSFSVLKEVLH